MLKHLGHFVLLGSAFVIIFIAFMCSLSGMSSLAYYLQDILPFSGLTVFGFLISDIMIFFSFLLASLSIFLYSYSRVVSDSNYSNILQVTSGCLAVSCFIFSFFLSPLFSPILTIS